MPPRSATGRGDGDRLLAALNEQLAALDRPTYTGPKAEALRACVAAVLRANDAGRHPVRAALRGAVRGTLDTLAERAPGRAVEVRVPPIAVTQCLPGPRHTRGTPANVVETDPLTWLALADGSVSWEEATGTGVLTASGPRADLRAHLPLL